MTRFSLSQLFMGTTFIAIVLVFMQTDGCGRRHTLIECLSFSPDDSRIVVTKLRAGDAHIPEKAYMDDFVRTVSWLDASTGRGLGLIHQDFRARAGGSQMFWRAGRSSTLCNPSNSHIAISAFGGGNVTRKIDTPHASVVSLQQPAYNLAYSKSGRLLAASGMWEVTVLDTLGDEVVMHAISEDNAFLRASLMSFADDGASIVLASDSSVHVWDIASATQCSTVLRENDHWVNFIAVAPNDSVIVCSYEWVQRYDFEGNVLAKLSKEGADLGAITQNGNRLATSRGSELTIYDLPTNKVLRTFAHQAVTALALSSNGEKLAVGDSNGRVTLIDIATGTQCWTSNPPERYFWPWTLPMACLIVWVCVAWRLSRRQKSSLIRTMED